MDFTAFIGSNLFAVISAVISFITSFAVIKVKIENLEKRMNKIDELKLEATLAEIKVEIKYVRALLESNMK